MATAPVLAAAAEMRRIWGTSVRVSTATVVRTIAGSTSWSQHAYGNAIDAFGSSIRLTAVASWAWRNSSKWSVRTIIHNRRVWTSYNPTWRTYTGVNPHTDHVHLDFNPKWEGTPPGYPVGSAPVAGKEYPVPPTNFPPYDAWLRPIAFGMYSRLSLSTRPEVATEAQAQAGVAAYRAAVHGVRSPLMTTATWERLDDIPIRRGSRGRVVETAQRMYEFYRVYPGILIDGIFGPQTEAATSRMQKAAGRRITGRVEAGEWRALYWGPQAWAVDDVGSIHRGDWQRPPDGVPQGVIGHSWAATLNGVQPHFQWGAETVARTARSIRALRS